MARGNGLRGVRDKQLEDRIAQAVGPDERMDLDELVGALRDVYPEYRRQKLTPFTRRVQDVVEQREAEQPPQARLQAAQAIAAQVSSSARLQTYIYSLLSSRMPYNMEEFRRRLVCS